MKMHASLSTSIALVLGTVALAGVSRPASAQWINDNPAGTTQCADADINDANAKVINCLVSNTRVVFAKLDSSAAVQLLPLVATPGGVPCVGSAISSASAGSGIIVGACRDQNNVWQGVYWKVNALGSAPTLLAPYAGLLGILGPGVKTSVTAIDSAGVVVGESIDGNGTAVPVTWSASGVATPLNAPGLLGLPAAATNCEVIDINDARTPQLIGDCPAGAGNGGKNLALLWTSAAANYVELPVPTGASYCVAIDINLSGQILGDCIYGTDTYRVVQWSTGGRGLAIMGTIVTNGAALRASGVAMNDSGVITGTYLSGGGTGGLTQTFRWDPSTGTSGIVIYPPANGSSGTPTGIGNDGKIVGNYFIPGTGDSHPFVVEANTNAAIDEGTCSGGTDAAAGALSKSGTEEVGVCIDSSGNAIGVEEPTP